MLQSFQDHQHDLTQVPSQYFLNDLEYPAFTCIPQLETLKETVLSIDCGGMQIKPCHLFLRFLTLRLPALQPTIAVRIFMIQQFDVCKFLQLEKTLGYQCQRYPFTFSSDMLEPLAPTNANAIIFLAVDKTPLLLPILMRREHPTVTITVITFTKSQSDHMTYR
jgi:hypothetical protein